MSNSIEELVQLALRRRAEELAHQPVNQISKDGPFLMTKMKSSTQILEDSIPIGGMRPDDRLEWFKYSTIYIICKLCKSHEKFQFENEGPPYRKGYDIVKYVDSCSRCPDSQSLMRKGK